MHSKPLVSVWMLTYNHEQYLEQAIESILMQKTDFPIEIVIGDDCSTDSTREIISQYEKAYPSIIKPILRPTNIGINRNFVDTWGKCKGKYIALLEGDDYWTDGNKLQDQFDFLEKNPEFVLCYHNTREVNEISGSEKLTNKNDSPVTTLAQLLEKGWYIRTGSIFLRNCITEFPDWFYRFQSTDYMMQILAAEKGDFAYLNKETNVYRRHENGITQNFQQNQLGFNIKKITLLEVINEYFSQKYVKQIKKQKENLFLSNFTIKSRNINGINDLRDWIFYFTQSNQKAVVKRLLRFFIGHFGKLKS